VSDDPARDAEFAPENYARVEVDVRKALKRSGCILPDTVIEAMTCTVLEESLQTRRRMVFMVASFNEAFAGEITLERLERLELILLVHHRGANNTTLLPVPDDEV
jgi:hypothetical protein